MGVVFGMGCGYLVVVGCWWRVFWLWVFSVRLNQWLGIHFNGFGLLLVGIFGCVGLVAEYKFRWLGLVVGIFG